MKTLLRLADTSEPFLQAVMHEIIRGIEREVPHAFALFRHLMGLEVGVSPATLSRAKAEALTWLRARADHNLHPRKRQSIPPACPALHHPHGNTWHQAPSIYLLLGGSSCGGLNRWSISQNRSVVSRISARTWFCSWVAR